MSTAQVIDLTINPHADLDAEKRRIFTDGTYALVAVLGNTHLSDEQKTQKTQEYTELICATAGLTEEDFNIIFATVAAYLTDPKSAHMQPSNREQMDDVVGFAYDAHIKSR